MNALDKLYNFATEEDKQTFYDVLSKKITNKIVVITSNARGAGKTHLAMAIMNAYGASDKTTEMPANGARLAAEIAAHAISGETAILFDNVKSIPYSTCRAIDNHTLLGTLFVNPKASESISKTNMLVVITANGNIEMSEDLKRRSVFINPVLRDEQFSNVNA